MITIDLKKLMTPKIDLVRNAIKAIDERHHSTGTYEGKLTDEEAKNDYTELMETLPKMPGLTEEEIKTLTEEIMVKINKIGLIEDSRFNSKNMKTEEDFLKFIDMVYQEQRHTPNELSFREITSLQAERFYKEIQKVLDRSELPEEAKNRIQTKLNENIENIPQVAKEVMEEYEQHKVEYHNMCLTAFEEAKERYSNLSNFEKLKYKMEHQSPEYIDPETLELEEIQKLYK